MKLLSRYVVREHIGPLLFALTALTSLVMLQYVARQLANLAGKGLPAAAIAKFFVLSLPFTIAMTLPMAVLVATLHAFGRMAAEHEITAFKASGVRVRALMAPVLFCALLLSLTMVWFNDQVLSGANHKLRVLQQDIARTKPTLALRDQVLNQVTESFFMRVSRSNAETNRIWDVVIYDLSRGPERRTIYADSGIFSMAGEDLVLQLFDGHSQEFVRADPRRLQRSFFRTQTIRQRNIARSFQSSTTDDFRGDREMSVCEMQRKYVVSAVEYERVRQEYIGVAARLLKPGEKGVRVPKERPRRVAIADLYCTTLPKIRGMLGVKTAKAQSAPMVGVIPQQQQQQQQQPPVTRDSLNRVQPPVQQPPVQQPPVQQPPVQQPPVQQPPVQQPPVQAPLPAGQTPLPPPGPTPSVVMPANPVPPTISPAQPTDTLQAFQGAAQAAQAQMMDARESLDSLNVEIQKKFALSFACLVFVLFGPPIALRFPRGGVGVTLGVSIVVFGLYYICLMGGETLSDKGYLPPSVSMWIANVVFALIGIGLLWRIESTTDTSRGGGLRDWWHDRKSRKALKKELRAARNAPRAEATA